MCDILYRPVLIEMDVHTSDDGNHYSITFVEKLIQDDMKFVYIFIWLGMMASTLCAQSYTEVVEQAMECTQKDSLRQAEALFRKALKMDPKNPRNALLFSNLGTVQKRMGKTDEAIESYSMALNITPYATAILLNRAALYMEQGLLDKAYLDYCNVIDLIPEEQEARLFRAYIYMQRRQYAEARIDYNVILNKDLKNKPARLGLVLLDEKEGRVTRALDALNLLISDYPQDASLLKMRANMEVDQQQWELALLDVEAAIQLENRDTESYLMKGNICLELGKKAEARTAFEQAIALGVPRTELQEKLKACK